MTQLFDTGSVGTREPAKPGPIRPSRFAPGRGWFRSLAGGPVLASFFASTLLSACTALPDWADPGAWFEEETPPPSRISAAQDPEQTQAGTFPNLASVPEEPRTATPQAERKALAAGLAADRENANYSGERLVASGAEAPGAASASAPAAPQIAKDMGVGTAPPPQTAAGPARAVMPTPAATSQDIAVGVPAGSTAIAPPPRQAQAPAPAPAPAQTPASAQAAVVVPGAAGEQTFTAALPRRAELAGIIYFAHGSSSLDANDRNILRDIVALSRERNASIRVVGHASARTRNIDPVEHQIANLEISQKRADSVAAALVQLGASRDRVRVEAQSDAQPVYHEFMPTGEAGNRRAEIFLEY